MVSVDASPLARPTKAVNSSTAKPIVANINDGYEAQLCPTATKTAEDRPSLKKNEMIRLWASPPREYMHTRRISLVLDISTHVRELRAEQSWPGNGIASSCHAMVSRSEPSKTRILPLG